LNSRAITQFSEIKWISSIATTAKNSIIFLAIVVNLKK
jgi:hypothetical protein